MTIMYIDNKERKENNIGGSKMQKKTIMMALGLVLLIGIVCFSGCTGSDDEDDTEDGPTVTVMGKAYTWSDLSKLTKITVDGNSGVQLSAIVNASGYASPASTVYTITASDGFAKNVTWGFMMRGIIQQTDMKTYFPDLPGRFKIKNTVTISASNTTTIKINGVELTSEMPFENWFALSTLNGTSGVKLSDLINYTHVASPETHQYKISAPDGYSKTVSWADMQSGLYVQDNYKSYFPHLAKGYGVKNIQKIEVV